MLPSELLAVWKRKGEIMPRYAKLSNENLEVANALIDAYKEHIGEKKKALKILATDLEDKGHEYRFIRALALLLNRRSIFISDSKVNPFDLRKKIFHTTEKIGIPTTKDQRQRILENVASEMALTSETVEKYMYADLDAELILEKLAPLSASELLEEYNLSLTQTLLFDSTELSFTTSGNWQRIFFSIKRLGLIYEVYQDNGICVRINGPASLFKLTKRYGIQTAKLLPIILANPKWTISAKILWKYTNEICNFKIESQKHSSLLKKPNTPTLKYDSTAEEKFASQFQALNSGWILKREPEPILAGKQVIIPDFSLEKSGIKVYLEIMGFWTETYLTRKIEKLKQIDEKMLLIVNEALACEKLAALKNKTQLNLIFYHNNIPLASILHYLQAAFNDLKTKEIELLKDLQIKFTEPIIAYDEFAARIGISTEAVKAVLATNPPSGYVAMNNNLVSTEKLMQINEKIEERMQKRGKLLLPEATKIVEAEGANDTSNILSALKYKITWRGINSEQAEISKTGK